MRHGPSMRLTDSMSDEFLPIRVSTLRGDARIKFNAYVQVAGKHILICREGDSFEGERLERLRGKKLARMYIQKSDEAAYQAYIAENISRVFENLGQKPVEVRTQILHGLLQATAEDLMESPTDMSLFVSAKKHAEKFVKLFAVEPAILNIFLNLKNTDFSVSHHEVTVAALALAISFEMGLAETHALKIVPMVLGALLHDIEHTYNNINFSVPANKLTKAEQHLHREHAMAGYERLNQASHFDPTTLIVVSEHEENIDGSGPRGKNERHLDLMSMVVSAANSFDHYLLYEDIAPKEALKKMLIDKMGLVHLEAMRGLQEALKKRGII